MKKFLKDITTTKDGETFDVVRVSIVGVTLFLPICLVWGIVLFTYGYFHDKPFDMHLFFDPIGSFLAMYGLFLLQGGGSLLVKQKTERETSISVTESKETKETKVES